MQSDAQTPGVELSPEETVSPALWRRLFSWSSFLVIGFLVFEFTASPLLGALVFCLKFGWHDVMTAHWLIRTDPIRSRGWTSGLFCSAWGLSKIAYAAHVAFFATGIYYTALLLGGNPQLGQVQGFADFGMLFAYTELSALALFSLLTWSAVIMALRTRRRIWIDSKLYWSRHHNVWPPFRFGRNRTEWVLELAVCSTVILSICIACALIVHLGGLWGFPRDFRILLAGGAAVLATAALLIVLAKPQRVIASTPATCWPELQDVQSADEEFER